MKKKHVIESFIYMVIIVVSIIMLIEYEPKNMDFEIPKAFEIMESGDGK